MPEVISMSREKWVAMTDDERLFCNSFWIKKTCGTR